MGMDGGFGGGGNGRAAGETAESAAESTAGGAAEIAECRQKKSAATNRESTTPGTAPYGTDEMRPTRQL